jgi:succinoglycan biosynthesis protein ExoM
MPLGERMGTERKVVAVGVCTCRNPAGLTKLLKRLAGVAAVSPPSRVIVVDNDLAHEGIEAVRAIAGDLPFRVDVVSEPRPGIPFARNRLFAEALREDFDYLAMLDDDEYPTAGWIEALQGTAEAAGADVVGGPVRPKFDVLPQWPVTEADFTKAGGEVRRGAARVFSTANVLVSRRLIEGWGEDWFVVEEADTGGCDTEFFRRTIKAGYQHAIASTALVFEDIPPYRARQDWVVARRFWAGNILARARKKQDGFLVALVSESARAIALALTALIVVARAPTDARATLRAKIALARAAGKLSGLAGTRHRAYFRGRYRSPGASEPTYR